MLAHLVRPGGCVSEPGMGGRAMHRIDAGHRCRPACGQIIRAAPDKGEALSGSCRIVGRTRTRVHPQVPSPDSDASSSALCQGTAGTGPRDRRTTSRDCDRPSRALWVWAVWRDAPDVGIFYVPALHALHAFPFAKRSQRPGDPATGAARLPDAARRHPAYREVVEDGRARNPGTARCAGG